MQKHYIIVTDNEGAFVAGLKKIMYLKIKDGVKDMESLREIILSRKHKIYRSQIDELSLEFKQQNLSDIERVVRRFELICSKETPVILPQQQIVFMRTIANLPDCFTADEWEEIRRTHYIHETGYVSNLLPDYETIIQTGLLSFREQCDDYTKREIDALIDLCDRYLNYAKSINRMDVVDVLSQIPRFGARTLKEAFQFFRILHYAFLIEGGYQIVGGRIDQIFYPYYKNDIQHHALTKDTALELIKDFFLSFNIDSDLYDGVQQGDNGQSVVLGGVDKNGNECFNELSELFLLASEENAVIDPKINLRVSSTTPLEIYELGSRLTKKGLGFPQYLNDDVIIEGLLKKGYSLEDARNYAVAACWEIIIPKAGFEVVNLGACSFPKVLEQLMQKNHSYFSFDELLNDYRNELFTYCDKLIDDFNNLYFVPAPLIQSCLDVKYKNFGIHGTGISTAVDSLYAIKKIVFDELVYSLDEFKSVVYHNFEGNSALLSKLRNSIAKMGQNHPEVDKIACDLLEWFCEALDGKINPWGGIYRAGTGTAMFYLDHANEIGASFDGRCKNEPFSANYSPSLYAKIPGPFSVLESFTKPNLVNAMNGGPLTLEFSSSMFHDDDAIRKTALFVRTFIKKGGHQLQCNSVNLQDLKKAQINPEQYRNLIVRIWGWSAYFVELDQQFQNHVIARQEYQL